jgi:hypothetical protein
MATRGHETDWLLQSGAESRRCRQEPYGNGTAWIGPYHPGDRAFAKSIQSLQATLNSFRAIRLARRNRYDVVIARNIFVRALACIVAARLSGAKFVYWLSYPYPEAWTYEAKSGISKRVMLTRARGLVSDFLFAACISIAASPWLACDVG